MANTTKKEESKCLKYNVWYVHTGTLQCVVVVMKVITMMKKDRVLELADYLGCNGEELYSELSKMNKITVRDENIKQAFIEYLQKDTDERFFQALTNFTQLFQVGTVDNKNRFVDLWHMEADEEIEWIGKDKKKLKKH